MATVTITQHHSGFWNVPDRYSVGAAGDVDQSSADYILPDGYTVEDGAIRDPDGHLCELVGTGRYGKGAPKLTSFLGARPDAVLQRAPQT